MKKEELAKEYCYSSLFESSTGHGMTEVKNAYLAGFDKAIEISERTKVEFAIEQLKDSDFEMCKLLRQEAINFDLTREEATYKWRRTKWHLIIQSKIKELEEQLKQL